MILRSVLRLALFVSTLAVAVAQSSLVFSPPAGVTAKGKHVVLLSGDEEYRSEEALPMLAKILSQRHGFKATVLFALDPDGTINPDNQKSLPGSEALDSADVIILALRFRNWPDADMKRFEAAYKRGVPIIALRTSTHPFNFPAESPWSKYTWNRKDPGAGGFGKQVLGETWVSHWGKHKIEATRAVVEASAATDPLLRGVTEVFGNSDVYEAYPPADAKILLRGLVLKGMNASDAPADYKKKRSTDKQEQGVNDPAMPVAWTRVHRNDAGKENKIFTTTLGAATDLENEGLRRLVVNGVYWAAGLNVPAKADVTVVDPYKPLMYGFKGYRIGLKPSDYALGKTVPEGAPRPAATPAPAKKTAAAATKSAAAAMASAPTLNAQPSTLNASTAFQLNPGERVAIVGNALADRMQHHGWLETMIHAKHPAHQIVVRNLSVSGDEVVARARSKDFGTPDEWLTKVQAGVVFAFFGYNESFAGPEGIAKFKEDLGTYLKETRAKNYNSLAAPRIVLFSPIATEKHPDPNYTFKPEVNANLAAYTQAMAEVARDQAGVTFVDLFAPSQALFAEAAKNGQPLTINGVHLNEAGEGKLAEKIYPTLFGEAAPPTNTPEAAKLRAAVNEKNLMWHSRYRTVDGYNVYGDRSKIAYVSHPDQPKITNTQIMMEEMAQRDVMTTNLERKAWALASGKTGPVEMLPLPVVTAFGTNKPGPKVDGTYEFIDGDEAIKLMTLAPGLKANLFASEKQFPELAKALQMNFDTKGRLWVAVWPSYPERTPTSKIADKIIILEDTDKDGRADKCTVFLDGLNCPTGFQFFKDGILLMQAPDVWFVRDTDGDGKGDWKERVLMGLDSADSHHTANSLIYEPGGAILFSDGVFHRSQVETVAGAVRNIDGAIYRYEPLTSKFETYIAYGFANPHGRAFDYWGNDLITDATGNNTYFGPAFSGQIDYPAKHPKMKTIWDRPSRPSAGSTILTSAHFPDEYWGDYLNPNVIGFQGIFRVDLSDDGAGIKGTREKDIVSSTDKNFRPIDTATGPDGALYVIDWHNPLIGHLQSHLRDSNRDHEHGRIYRITAEGRPLSWQPKIDGEPIPALLELLKRRENQIRNLAKVELGKHDSAKVIAATKSWAAALDQKAPDYAHHLLEALWVHQWHNVVDVDLLSRLLRSPNANARAAAVRVLCYWRDRVPNALSELQRLASDENPRVRLQAVRAASFFPVAQATEVALAATKLNVDYYLDYTIGETLRQLRPQWRKSIGEGATIAGGDPASVRYLLRTLSAAELLKMPRTAEVSENILGRRGVNDAVRAEALAALVKQRNAPAVSLLLATIDSPAEIDVRGVGRLLLAQPPADLKPHRAALLKLGLTDTSEARSFGWAGVALADDSLDPAWKEAAGSPLSLQSLIGGIHLLPNPTIRATAYERMMELLARPITDYQGPDHIIAATQRDAIRSLVSTRREPAAVFATLTSLIERGYQVPAAAQGIRSLPRNTWPAASIAPVTQALVAWAGKTHVSERTSRDYVETIQIADELAGALPATEAETMRKTITRLRVGVYVVRSVVEQMRYDTPRIVVQQNKAFELIFENPDVMPHNLVVVEPGARERVATAALALPPEFVDRSGRAWVPESREIIAATKLLEPGQSESLKIRPIREEGVYEFVCTFPGHWTVMYGQLVVTKDVDAYLKANPAPAAPAAAATEHKH
ncbi:PVC-type heme-binding CxxCH protein [Horticoccus sp. 23ND18S-11]|uniref:PVC-type heme-binding CxxCH protein n=1 Tax=Horticoccus sp. 23ND18S-11 TaxID=3391832 RepID=UPI0039C9D1EA